MRVIKALNGEIVTECFTTEVSSKNGLAMPDLPNDILKIAVVNRYKNSAPAIAFIRGFGLKAGAIASCVAHDSHNIIAVGTDDEALCQVVNLVIGNRGGIAAATLSLPIAGIMTNEDGYAVATKYAEIDTFVKNKLGTPLDAPFMTLSFMALLVIPSLKLSDQGLFDGNTFAFTNLFI